MVPYRAPRKCERMRALAGGSPRIGARAPNRRVMSSRERPLTIAHAPAEAARSPRRRIRLAEGVGHRLVDARRKRDLTREHVVELEDAASGRLGDRRIAQVRAEPTGAHVVELG